MDCLRGQGKRPIGVSRVTRELVKKEYVGCDLPPPILGADRVS